MQEPIVDSSEATPRNQSRLDSLSEEGFLWTSYAASFIGAYVAGLAASYGLAAWEFSAASTIKPWVLDTLALPIRRWNGSVSVFLANTVFWLIPLVICLAISTLWVKPFATSTSRSRRMRLSATATVGVLASLALFVLWARFEEGKHRKGYENASCQKNLQQLSMALRMYASDRRDGIFPELSSTAGTLAVTDGVLVPEYLNEISVLHCPAWNLNKRWYQPPKRKNVTVEDDRSYFYLGYRIPDQATLEQFAAAYRTHSESGKPFDVDLPLGTGKGVVSRLHDTDPLGESSRIPVFVERYPNGHDPASGNVLYLDGHIERVKWGEKWPMTTEAMEVLLSLDGLGDD